MNPEHFSSQEGPAPRIPEQLNFDFDEAAVLARAKELRKEHDWTQPYAVSVARIEFQRKRWEAKQAKEKQPR